MKIKIYNMDEIREYVDKNVARTTNEQGYPSFEGFHFFNPGNIVKSKGHTPHNKGDFICAFTADEKGNEKLVGVTFITKRHLFYDENVKQRNPIRYSLIEYVDVHTEFRQKGVMTAIYQFINTQYLRKGSKITATRPSRMGRSIHIQELRFKLLDNLDNYLDVDEMYEKVYLQFDSVLA